MYEETEKFYSTFCKMTQSKNGMWEQRFYTDGRLAPCWGYQIDETASVIFGIYAHYKVTKNKKFLKDNLKMCENAINFLEKYIDDLLGEKGIFQPSYDLWEEHEGTSFYSVAAIFAAFSAMIKIYGEVKPLLETNKTKMENIKQQVEKLEKEAAQIKEYCLKTFYDGEKNSFVRNTSDRKIDISLLGPIVPFKMFLPDDKKVKNTIERINMTLRTYTGGYIRYEGDGYMGGYNPWPIATLWMSWYYLEAGDTQKALENFKSGKRDKILDNFWGWVFALPLIVGLVLFLLIPVGFAVFYSFTDYSFSTLDSFKFEIATSKFESALKIVTIG